MTATATTTDTRGAPTARPGRRFTSVSGVVPFFLFAALFMILPVGYLVIASFQVARTGAPTLQNYIDLGQPSIAQAFASSIEISLVTAITGGLLGFLLAYAVILGGLPKFLRGIVMTFSGVASNFAGIPLALAFTFTLGFQGLVTKFLLWNADSPLIDLYGKPPDGLGFNLYTKLGLELVYLYFQFPLMVLIIAPAIDGLKKEWREASENMGASAAQYWRHIALPVLTPTILGSVILLFGNSFGAQATAYQLTAGLVPLVTNLISDQISGDVFHNVNLGYAMAMGMVAIMAISITGYSLLQRRTEKWLRCAPPSEESAAWASCDRCGGGGRLGMETGGGDSGRFCSRGSCSCSRRCTSSCRSTRPSPSRCGCPTTVRIPTSSSTTRASSRASPTPSWSG